MLAQLAPSCSRRSYSLSALPYQSDACGGMGHPRLPAPLAKFFIESNLAVPVEPWRNHGHTLLRWPVSALGPLGIEFLLVRNSVYRLDLTWLTLVMGIFSYVLFVTQQPTLACVVLLDRHHSFAESHAIWGLRRAVPCDT